MRAWRTGCVTGLLCGVAASFCASTVLAAEDPAARFAADCAAKAAAAAKTDQLAVPAADGWLFLAAELHHVGAGRFWGDDAKRASACTKPEFADPLPVILDFNDILAKAGVELLLVPVPPKAFIYADKLSPAAPTGKDAPRLDPQHQEFYRLLGEKGVKVLDLTADFAAARNAGGDPLFCRTDSHWSGRGCTLAAQKIAAELKKRPWFKQGDLRLEIETREVEIAGDLRDAANDAAAREKLPLTFVGRKADGKLVPVETDAKSPILVLADSHGLVFHAGGDMHAAGAGLVDHLARELGAPVDLIAVRGSGATPVRVELARRVRAERDYLGGKKVVVWCFGAREFTESFAGWRKVPVVPPAARP